MSKKHVMFNRVISLTLAAILMFTMDTDAMRNVFASPAQYADKGLSDPDPEKELEGEDGEEDPSEGENDPSEGGVETDPSAEPGSGDLTEEEPGEGEKGSGDSEKTEGDVEELPQKGDGHGRIPEDGAASGYVIRVNGAAAGVKADGYPAVSVFYRSAPEITVAGEGGTALDGAVVLYAQKEEVDAADYVPDAFLETNRYDNDAPATLMPGDYYLIFYTDEIAMPIDEMKSFGISVAKVGVAAPGELSLVGDTTGLGGVAGELDSLIASWNVPEKDAEGNDLDAGVASALNYELKVYKDGAADPVETITDSALFSVSGGTVSCDLTAIAKDGEGYGSYTFTVKAIPGDGDSAGEDRYLASSESSASSAFDYRDEVAPVLTGYGVNAGGNGFTATLSDNVGVAFYAFTTSSAAPASGATVWTAISAANTDQSLDDLTGPFVFEEAKDELAKLGSGSYYLHVRDADGNTASSSSALAVTVLTLDANDASTPAQIVLLGTDEGGSAGARTTLADASEEGGLDFEGWFLTQTPETDETAVTTVVVSDGVSEPTALGTTLKIPAGADRTLYAHWASQDYDLTLTPETTGKVYDGTGAGCGLSISAVLSNKKYPLKGVKYDDDSVSYSWYKKADDPDGTDELVGSGTMGGTPLSNTMKITQVSESGTYYAKVSFTANGMPQLVISDPVTVEITKADLELTAADLSIGYGDPVPTAAELSIDHSKTVGLMSGDSEEDQILNITTNYTQGAPAGGSYYIRIVKKTQCNYNITLTDGTLTVGRKDASADGSGVTVRFAGGAGYSDTYRADYTGEEITPAVAVFQNGVLIDNEGGLQYTVTYDNAVNASTEDHPAKVVVTFLETGNYSGILYLPFTIDKASFTPEVKMRNGLGVDVSTEAAKWVYGYNENALDPYVPVNPSSEAPIYYYAPAENGTTCNRETATTTRPTDAGNWYVWAYIPASSNYQEAISAPFGFTIEKRVITLTAGTTRYPYDGKLHVYDNYTKVGDFVAPDAFKSITVTGSITDVGSVDNVITYELTPTTIANSGNYDIRTISGKVYVDPVVLSIPGDLDWSSSGIATLEWTPISQNNLTVEYQVSLYRVSTDGQDDVLLGTQKVEGSEHSFETAIRSDIASLVAADPDHAGAGYYAVFRSMPKEVSGEAYANYQPSVERKTSVIYSAKVELKWEETEVEKAYFAEGAPNESVRFFLPGEVMPAYVIPQPGYSSSGHWVSSDDTLNLWYPRGSMNRLEYTNPAAAPTSPIRVSIRLDDSHPSILSFEARTVATEADGLESGEVPYGEIRYDLHVYDHNGLEGYALVAASDRDALLAEIDAHGLGDLTAVGASDDGHYHITTYGRTEGRIYLVVRDLAGNVTVCDDEDAVNIYKISFQNGASDEEDPSLYTGTMPELYKVAGSTIILPENEYTKTGFYFTQWVGDSGSLYQDQAAYVANRSDVLHAQWTNTEYSYKVLYYYAAEDGTYDGVEPEEKTFSGAHYANVTSATASIQQSRIGFTRDTDSDKQSSVVLGTDEDPVVKVYYKRNQYKITYTFVNPDTGLQESSYDAFYYGTAYTIREPLTKVGYSFVGWSIANFDTKEETLMPARDLEASGSFTADTVNYHIRYYCQNLPVESGTIAGGDYSETPSEVYTLNDEYSKNYISTQGAVISSKLPVDPTDKSVAEIEGFTPYAVAISLGAPFGSSAPTQESETVKILEPGAAVDEYVEGIVDATPGKELYINYYYTRNVYNMTLTVWKDKRDVPGNEMFRKNWSISYGRTFTAEETTAIRTFGYNDDVTANEWIRNDIYHINWLNSEGTDLADAYSSYELADYTDWSSGKTEPDHMPAGDVSVTKEYVQITTAHYTVEFYFQTVQNNEVVYPDKPTYSVYYTGPIRTNVVLQKTEQASTLDTEYLSYDKIGSMLDENFASYSYDAAPVNALGEALEVCTEGQIVKADESTSELELKVYFKRAKMPVTITYQFTNAAKASQKIISYDVWAEWGTKIYIEPARFFYGTEAAPDGADATTAVYNNYSDFAGLPYEYTAVAPGTLGFTTDYNAKPCEISYSGYRYISSKGGSWPNGIYTLESQLYDRTADTFKTIEFEVGQGNRGSSTANRMTITYSELEAANTYFMNMSWGNSAAADRQIIEKLGQNPDGSYYQIARIKDFDEEGAASYTYKVYGKEGVENGTEVTEADYTSAETYYIRIANKKDIFETTVGSIAGGEGSKYNAEAYISAATDPTDGMTYTYGGIKTDGEGTPLYSAISVTTLYGTGSEYYLSVEGGNNYIYLPNLKNNFFEGNYVVCNVDAAETASAAYCSNPAKLGFADAETRRSYGYDVYDEHTYGIHTPISDHMWDTPDYYYFSQVERERQTIYLQYGTKSTSYTVSYGTIYHNPYHDSRVDASFSVDEGYRIVWYEDVSYTVPVPENKNYTATKRLNFYGRREKDLVVSYDFISYELSEEEKTELGTTRDYIDGSNYTSWFGDFDTVVANAKSDLAETGHEVIADTIERSYLDNQFIPVGSDPVVRNYLANRYKFYVDGSLVMTIVENKSLSYSTISLPYDEYEEGGFTYSKRDSNNKTNGYVQKDSITLCAYYHRNSYQISVYKPSSVNDQVTAHYPEVHPYEEMITETKPSRTGYTFAGWEYENLDAGTKMTPADLRGYDVDPGTGSVSFHMPSCNLKMTAKWIAAPFEYEMVSYFQQGGSVYAADEFSTLDVVAKPDRDALALGGDLVNGSAVSIKLGDLTYSDGVLYDLGAGGIYAALTIGAHTYYFKNPTVSGDVATVKAAGLIASVRTLDLVTYDSSDPDSSEMDVADYIDPNLDLFGIYSYAFTTYVSGTENNSLTGTGSFKALPEMTLNYFYSRSVSYTVRVKGIAVDSAAGSDEACGMDVTGGSTSAHYGDTISLEATLESGYEFKGWYVAEEILPGYTQATDYADLDGFTYVDPDKLATAVAIPSVMTINDQGKPVYTAQAEIENNADYIAVSLPVNFTTIQVTVNLLAGRTDYTFGYADSPSNYLEATVSIPAEYKDKVSVKGYQWYLVESASAIPRPENMIPGATSSTYLVPTGLSAGTHYYQCVVTVERTDNGRKGTEHAETAKALVVKPFGYDPGSDLGVAYHSDLGYDGYYDGNSHTIDVWMSGTMHPANGKYRIYYSERPLTSWAEVTEGLLPEGGAAPYVFHQANNEPTDELRYTDVLLDEGGSPVARKVYYYIHTEEDDLDRNFRDSYGYQTVMIRPIAMTVVRTTNPFRKRYDASCAVTGSDYERLLNGEEGKSYYALKNADKFLSESGLTLSFDANYDNMHVEGATLITLSNLCVKYTEGEKAGQVDPNYVFPAGYTASLSGYITAFPLSLSWNEEASFVYNGDTHARRVSLLTPMSTIPDADLELISRGEQTNVGNYRATAALKTEGKSYNDSDYSFDIESAPYTITACPITVSPKSEHKTYNGLMQYITEYEITRGGVSYDVNEDGTGSGLFGSQHIVMGTIRTDKGRKNAGTETISIVNGTIKIYESGIDITYDYDITYGTGTLTIDPKTVTFAGATGISKVYDGNNEAQLLTTEKTVGGTTYQVLAEGTAPAITPIALSGVVSGDDLAVNGAKASLIRFANATVQDGKSISFVLEQDCLVGADAANYTLDLENSTLTATANITKQQILVKVIDLSAGTVYGETPAFEVVFSGFKGTDTEAVISGVDQLVYLLTDKDAASPLAVEADNYESGGIYRIPVNTNGYDLSLKLDSDGYVYGLSADDYCFVPYAAPYISETYEPILKITGRPLTVTGKDRDPIISKTYDGDTGVDDPDGNAMDLEADVDYELETESSGRGILTGDEVDIDYTAAYNSKNVADADHITVTELSLKKANASSDDAYKNYVIETESFDVSGVITPKELTVTAENKTVTYGDSAPVYTAIASGYVTEDAPANNRITNGNGITLSCAYNTLVPANRGAGEYEITPSALTDTNYTLVVGEPKGKLTVQKKKITVGVEEKSIIYGKEHVPNDDDEYGESTYTRTYEGWITAYGDSKETILDVDSGDGTLYSGYVTAILDKTAADTQAGGAGTHDDAAYPYAADGYDVVTGCVAGHDLNDVSSITNYEFEYVSGKLKVKKQYISVSGITTDSKVYDGNTNAPIDYSGIRFTCYVSGTSGTTYAASDLLPGGADIEDNLAITGTYQNTTSCTDGEGNTGRSVAAKDVGSGKNVSLTLALKEGSYLADRYELIQPGTDVSTLAEFNIAGAEASQGTTTDGEITKKPLTIKIYYAQQVGATIKYGEDVDLSKFGYTDVAPNTFVAGEGIDQLAGAEPKLQYQLVNASGVPYSNTSPVGKYYVTFTGNLNSVGTNYDLTIIGAVLSTESSTPVNVDPNQLKTPEPVWSSSAPGTITWTAITGYGEVGVDHYEVKLYEGGNLTTPIATDTVAAGATLSVNYADTIRTNGPGRYLVKIRAIAETDPIRNPAGESRNVLDSLWGTSGNLFAANIIASYSGAAEGDTVTPRAIGGAASKIEINSTAQDLLGRSTYCMISGESAPIFAGWTNADGYSTGYSVGELAISDSTSLTVSNVSDGSGAGTYSADLNVTLTSASDITVKLSLAARPATLTGEIQTVVGSAYYNFTDISAPNYIMAAVPASTDNLTLVGSVEDSWPYTYTYSWTYAKVSTYSVLNGQTDFTQNDREIKVSSIPVIPASTYNLRCLVTATRKDNGETTSKTFNLPHGMVIRKISLGNESSKAVVDDWTFGEPRKVPDIKTLGDADLPAEIGTVTYYFKSTALADILTSWKEWTDEVYPEDAGTYHLYAVVADSENYDGFNTKANKTTFTISRNVLTKHTNNVTLLSDADLTMGATTRAPYGKAKFYAAYGPKENGDSATNYITPSYKVILYRRNPGLGGDVKLSEYVSGEGGTVILAGDGTGSVDVSADMNEKGTYYFTVQAFSDNTDNCDHSAIYTSEDITVYDNLLVKDESGTELTKSADGNYHYTYDGRNVIMEMTSGIDGATYQWYENHVPISGAVDNTYKVRYVSESANYSCQITIGDNTYESSTASVVIDPRVLTIATGSDEKEYDATPLTKDEWWVIDAAGTVSAATAVTGGSVTEPATDNTVSGIAVTGSKTAVTMSGTTVTAEDNTYDLSSLVITEPARPANGNVSTVVYDAAMAEAGIANYTFTGELGTLKVTKATLEITSGSDSKLYDGTPLTKESVTTGVSGSHDLLTGDTVYSVNYTGTVTEVQYSAGAVVGVDNTFDTVVIYNSVGDDVTDSYNIVPHYGTLTILPRTASYITAAITNAIAGTSDPYEFNWTGGTITPAVLVQSGLTTLVKGTDYDLSGDLSKKAVNGSYTITIELKGNYTGTIDLTWAVLDVQAPTGSIKFSAWDLTWSELLSKISFGLYHNDSVTVTIRGVEEDGGSGIASLQYYVTDAPATDGMSATAEYDTLTAAQLDALSASVWTTPEGVTTGGENAQGTFEIAKADLEQKVVYVKVKDAAGHVTYLCSNGLVIDGKAPVFEGTGAGTFGAAFTSDTTYCISKEFKVLDRYLSEVEIKDANGNTIASVSRTALQDGTAQGFTAGTDGLSYTYTLVGDPHGTGVSSTTYTITAKDLAGNVTVISNVTINKDHSFAYTGSGTDTLSAACTVDTCEEKEASDLTVQVSAIGGEYNGLAYPATVTTSSRFTSLAAGTVGEITYHKTTLANETTGGTLLDGAPVHAGHYYAECIVRGTDGVDYRVVKAYEITKVPLSQVTVEHAVLIYNGTHLNPGTITVKAIVNGAEVVLDPSTDYELTDDPSAKKQTTAVSVGTYTVEAVARLSGNYSGTVSCTYQILDDTDPVFDGSVAEGGKYCCGKDITISDATLKEVTILSRQGAGAFADDMTAYALDAENSTETAWTYHLYGSAAGTEYKITGKDESDNTVTITFMVWDDHSFTNYDLYHSLVDPDPTHQYATERIADCDHECGATDTAKMFWGNITWDYAYSYIAPGDVTPTTGVQSKEVRCTHARIELQQAPADSSEFVTIATTFADCDTACGAGADPAADDGQAFYAFTTYDPSNALAGSGTALIPEKDEHGANYHYRLKIEAVMPNDQGGYTVYHDYAKLETTDYSDPDVGHRADFTYAPDCFDVPWKVTLKNLPAIGGHTVTPQSITVKVLYAYSENADDTETPSGYQVLSQLVDTGIECGVIDNGDGTYSYEGDYPCWKYQAGSTDSYYHRIQIVGYTYDDVYYDVTAENYKSINDHDHVNHTICYDPTADNGEGGASGTILYELSGLPMPVLLLDYNEGADQVNHASNSGDIHFIVKDAFGAEVTAAELTAVALTRPHYTFLGWFTQPSGGVQVTSIPSLDAPTTIYAHWQETIPPRGVITIADSSWRELLHSITFERFFNNTQTVTIRAYDDEQLLLGGSWVDSGVVDHSGVESISYYVTDQILTQADLEALGADDWTVKEHVSSTTFAIDPNAKYVIYVKLLDKAGNVSYLSSDGTVLDNIPPVISGASANTTYCEDKTITITDLYLDTVVIKDRDGNVIHTASRTDEPASFTVGEGGVVTYQYTLTHDPGVQGVVGTTYIVTATDRAGNSTTLQNTRINGEHTWGPAKITWRDDYTAYADFVCLVDASHTIRDECTITRAITKPATGSTPGEITYTATVVRKNANYVPTTYTDKKKAPYDLYDLEDGEHTFTTKVVVGIGAPAADVTGLSVTAAKQILDAEGIVYSSDDTEVTLKVSAADPDSTIKGQMLSAAQAAHQGVQEGSYFETSLEAEVGAGPAQNITDGHGVSMHYVIRIPAALRNTDGSKTRTFYLMMLDENGDPVEVDATFDPANGGSFRFDSSLYTTYLICYKDTLKPAIPTEEPDNTPAPSGHGGGNGEEPGGQSTPVPTVKPSSVPTAKPTITPTAKPSSVPSARPVVTPKASAKPTPTEGPGGQDPARPTETPTSVPGTNTEDPGNGNLLITVEQGGDTGDDPKESEGGTEVIEGGSGEQDPGNGHIAAELPKKEEVVTAVLTEEEKDLLDAGEDIHIRLIVSDDPEERDDPALEKLLEDLRKEHGDGEEVASFKAYVDLKLEKKIGSQDWERILQSGQEITVEVLIPDGMRREGETLYLARLTENGYVILEDLDTDPDTITIMTNDFESQYVIVSLEDEPVALAGGEKCYWHYLILLADLIWLLFILLTAKKRDEDEAEGANAEDGQKQRRRSTLHRYLSEAGFILLMILINMLGHCRKELIWSVVSGVLVAALSYLAYRHKFGSDGKEQNEVN